ncbi:hypothetical protein HaloA020_03330 [Halomonas sp. A020]|nr:hypothetical protein HaloA020_03330 [Halomonas sp. A020]
MQAVCCARASRKLSEGKGLNMGQTLNHVIINALRVDQFLIENTVLYQCDTKCHMGSVKYLF